MPDEFESPGRTFRDGSDTCWTALHKNDYTKEAQKLYSRDNNFTNNDGELIILTEVADTDIIGFEEVTNQAFAIQSTSNPI